MAQRLDIAINKPWAHVGIVASKSDGGDVRFVHYGWHGPVTDDDANKANDYHVAAPHLNSKKATQVCAMLREIVRLSESIPYGFQSPVDSFDETGRFRNEEGLHLGLTCATFVLAVFDSAAAPLVKAETWETRVDDAAKIEYLIAMLEGGLPKVPAGHIERLRKAKIEVRFRPLDVFGAALWELPPADFKQAVQAGERFKADTEGRV